jgi:hypothetical protein
MPNRNPRAWTLSFAALLLAGCGTARPYDPAQVPAAQQQQAADVGDCMSKTRHDFHNPSDFVRCFTEAELRFARAIHVSDPRMLDGFRRQMADIGRRADAHRISWADVAHLMNEAEQNFENNLAAAYRADDARRAAAGQAGATQAAAYRADDARRAAAGQAGATQAAAIAQRQPDCAPVSDAAGSMAAALDPNACR